MLPRGRLNVGNQWYEKQFIHMEVHGQELGSPKASIAH